MEVLNMIKNQSLIQANYFNLGVFIQSMIYLLKIREFGGASF
tara:strand:+ start:785 stop:910 length:126 start_codon:yes stop_codon:yes gene_type:complete